MKNNLRSELDKLVIFDGHEHIMLEQFYCSSDIDFFDLLIPYVIDDLKTCGMTEREEKLIFDKNTAMKERIDAFLPYYKKIRFGSYCRCLSRTLKECFEVERIDERSIQRVNEIIRAQNKPGLYAKLQERSNIRLMLSCVGYDKGCINLFDGELVRPVPTLSQMMFCNPDEKKRVEQELGRRIETLDDFLDAINDLFEFYVEKNIRAIKIGIGYDRKLDMKASNPERAQHLLNRINEGDFFSQEECSALSDYLLHIIAKRCEEHSLPLIFHLGIHAWNENNLERARANYMTEFVKTHPDTIIILLHCGIPYLNEAIMLAKYYRNVYVDLTWVHIIDEQLAKSAIRHALDMLPLNKTLGFGGDFFHFYNTIGHIEIAKDNIADVLGEFIQGGRIDYADAVEISKSLLHDNAERVYGI